MFRSTASLFTVLLFLLTFLTGVAKAQAGDNRKYLLDPAVTAINGINISTKEDHILKRLGKPKSVEKGYSEVESKPSKYLHYDGMKIYLIDENIYNFSCTGKKCQTDRGVKVGDSKSKVIEIYGSGNPPYAGSKRDTLRYPLRGLDSYLIFLFEENTVVEIEFWVDFV